MLGEAKGEARRLSFPVHLYPWGGESYIDANYSLLNFETLATLDIIIICKTHLSVYTLKNAKKRKYLKNMLHGYAITKNIKPPTSCLLPFIVRDHFGFINSRAVQVQPAHAKLSGVVKWKEGGINHRGTFYCLGLLPR